MVVALCGLNIDGGDSGSHGNKDILSICWWTDALSIANLDILG